MYVTVLLGMALGALFAHTAAKPAMDFKKKLLAEYEFHLKNGAEKDFISRIVQNRRQWIRSISIIRKPFRTEVNLAIETAAFILAAIGVFNSLVHFHRYFDSVIQGGAALVFLGAIVAFLPVQWLITLRVDREIETVFGELKRALLSGNLKDYMTEAKTNWQ